MSYIVVVRSEGATPNNNGENMSKQLKVKMLKREYGNYVCRCLKNNKVPQTFSEFVEEVISIAMEVR